jgi:hypothetical protein
MRVISQDLRSYLPGRGPEYTKSPPGATVSLSAGPNSSCGMAINELRGKCIGFAAALSEIHGAC